MGVFVFLPLVLPLMALPIVRFAAVGTAAFAVSSANAAVAPALVLHAATPL